MIRKGKSIRHKLVKLSAEKMCSFTKLMNICTYRRLLTEESSKYEPRHEISNNVVVSISKASDQPAPRRSLIRAFASRLIIL